MVLKSFGKETKIAEILAVLIILTVNFLLKVPIVSKGFFAFTFDQGRDFLLAAKIIYDGRPVLIGPTTGQQGIFYGPTWYYFLSPILYISGGDPQKVAIIFSLLGVLTLLCLYLFFRFNTKFFLLALSLGIIASMSSFWMIGPTVIWNTALTPLLMIFVAYLLGKIVQKPQASSFLLLGVTIFLIFESEMPWGIVMILFTLLCPFIFKKYFLKKNFLFTILGFLIVGAPRILFNLRHNFLELNAVIKYLQEPRIYGQQESFVTRAIGRLDLYWGIFSETFTKGNKVVGLILAFFLLVIILLTRSNKPVWNKFKDDFILRYFTYLVVFSLVIFTFFKDIVWAYYLIGLPISLLIIIFRIFNFSILEKKAKNVSILIIIFLFIFNFNYQLFYPFKVTWLGDNATYRNEKAVVDYIASQNPHNYAIYSYSPALFDYAFDYLIYWYTKSKGLERPVQSSNSFYLIIREASSDKYLYSGWYGDKTKDNTTVLEAKQFNGDLLVEKHLRNEN